MCLVTNSSHDKGWRDGELPPLDNKGEVMVVGAKHHARHHGLFAPERPRSAANLENSWGRSKENASRAVEEVVGRVGRAQEDYSGKSMTFENQLTGGQNL